MATQLTKDEAVAFNDDGKWSAMSPKERAIFQLEQDRLCMPFDVFHQSVEQALGRPVSTHEFARNRDAMLAELKEQP